MVKYTYNGINIEDLIQPGTNTDNTYFKGVTGSVTNYPTEMINGVPSFTYTNNHANYLSGKNSRAK